MKSHPEPKRVSIVFRCFLVIMMILPAALSCSSDGSDPAEPDDNNTNLLGPNQGQFIDSPVKGLQFVSGNRSGTTDSQGVFSFQTGADISFFVGDISLGTVSPGRKLNPLNLAQTTDISHPVALNLARFLQSIDNDGNHGNGINITQAVREAAAGKSVNFVQTGADFENDPNVQSVVEALTTETAAGTRELVSADAAQAALATGIRTAYGGQYSGAYCVEGETESGGKWAVTVSPDGRAKIEFLGVVDFIVSCHMALNGTIYAEDPERGIKVCGSFAPGFQGYWSSNGMRGAYAEGSCAGTASLPGTEDAVCGQ